MSYVTLKKQYDIENEKAYLKQKYDTAKFFNLTRQLFETLDRLDTADVAKNGNPKFRKKNSELLNTYRRNLLNAGNYYLRKNDNKRAYQFFNYYINTADKPLFSSYNYLEKDTLMPMAAFWSTVSASLNQTPEMVLKHAPLARTWIFPEQVMQFEVQAYTTLRSKIDRESLDDYKKINNCIKNTLKDGFKEHPTYTFFFNKLIEFYSERNELDSALLVCNEAVGIPGVDPNVKKEFLYAKTGVLLKQKKFEECIPLCEQIISIDSTFAAPYYNLGLCYYEKALPLTRKEKKVKRSILGLSRQYIEKYRDMAPQDKKRWGPLLYKIYFDLNLGKKFSEVDGLL